MSFVKLFGKPHAEAATYSGESLLQIHPYLVEPPPSAVALALLRLEREGLHLRNTEPPAQGACAHQWGHRLDLHIASEEDAPKSGPDCHNRVSDPRQLVNCAAEARWWVSAAAFDENDCLLACSGCRETLALAGSRPLMSHPGAPPWRPFFSTFGPVFGCGG
jgi:hypothetical protein